MNIIPIKRSRTNVVFGGVIAGLCEKWGWNPTVGRLLYVVLTLTSWFAGIPVYLVLWLLMGKPE
ncbi:PspC domain-containing protein [Companilactobacillus mishanensis]|uniref:PspC domain-containing protein n=1 Tax=Companilactobacillus mishanensis TaxID=2486008 RepID=A0A5P0ZG72_9LACO|nr:PspC domain-containing protein [Companilactobacillus mishanensis]MQS45448.1 PspC domain-containing protein [Companilactobacillus mishanensis]MQS52032.1 PspC domain-containing protein [Companilactobacillus mishanensis]MQS88844.1 PspC domain-containing protein [Companilactobacillus mishanensis]